jgi:hypothetical protein
MTVARETQEPVEVLSNANANLRQIQEVVEVISNFILTGKVSQHVVEVISNFQLHAIQTQSVVETLSPYTTTTFIYPTEIPSEEAFDSPVLAHNIYPVEIPSEEAFGTPVLVHYIYPLEIPSEEAFGTASADIVVTPESISSEEAFGVSLAYPYNSRMKGFFEVLLPPGAIWQPRPDGDFDKFIDGMGNNAQVSYEYIDLLGYIRDPRRTSVLEDLEKEYGILTNDELSELTRRVALAATKYAIPNTASWEHLQDRLRAAGFDDIIVNPNDPAIDPALIDGSLIVNGTTYSAQGPAYLMECNGDFAFCGNGKAVCGYFINNRRIETEYPIPPSSPYWRFFFFVGGAASGWPSSPSIAHYTVEAGRLEELKRLILKYKPIRSWCILNAGY